MKLLLMLPFLLFSCSRIESRAISVLGDTERKGIKECFENDSLFMACGHYGQILKGLGQLELSRIFYRKGVEHVQSFFCEKEGPEKSLQCDNDIQKFLNHYQCGEKCQEELARGEMTKPPRS